MDASQLLEQVMDRSSFLAFVRALASEARDSAPEWQNASISDFLESAAAWMEDAGVSPHQPSWRDLAQFLYAGKIYE